MNVVEVEVFFKELINASRSYSKQIDDSLKSFFSDLQYRTDIYKSTKKKFDLNLASDFTVFNFIKPDENKLSDIIAQIIFPEGNHGQGDVFLKNLLNIIQAEEIFNIQKCSKVIREDTTTKIENQMRRLDIVIAFQDCGIGIENKPWAVDQKEQCCDYCRELSKRYNDRYMLLYISGDGKGPEKLSAEEKNKIDELKKNGKFRVLGYSKELKKWLEDCYKECKAEKVRWFLKDFTDYIEENFRHAPYKNKVREAGNEH